jgi:hypothetical protein
LFRTTWGYFIQKDGLKPTQTPCLEGKKWCRSCGCGTVRRKLPWAWRLTPTVIADEKQQIGSSLRLRKGTLYAASTPLSRSLAFWIGRLRLAPSTAQQLSLARRVVQALLVLARGAGVVVFSGCEFSPFLAV